MTENDRSHDVVLGQFARTAIYWPANAAMVTSQSIVSRIVMMMRRRMGKQRVM